VDKFYFTDHPRDSREVYGAVIMKRYLPRIFAGFLALGFGMQTLAEEEKKTVVAAKVATQSTADLVSNFTTASFYNSFGVFRIQLGEYNNHRGAAASDDSEFETISFSVTPTVASIDNRVEPILVKGDVSLVILGIEKFNELDMIANGITLTLDSTSVTSKEVGLEDAASAVSGNGWTVAPYHVRQLENGFLLDINTGIGKNRLNTSSSNVTASPVSSRMFISTGLSSTEPLDNDMYLQYKGSLSLTKDKVDSYTQSDNSTVEDSETTLRQIRLGATLTKQLDGWSPFISGTLIGNSFSASGGGGTQPKEHSFTQLMKAGFNFSNDLLYGSFAHQVERDKSSTLFYIGFRF